MERRKHKTDHVRTDGMKTPTTITKPPRAKRSVNGSATRTSSSGAADENSGSGDGAVRSGDRDRDGEFAGGDAGDFGDGDDVDGCSSVVDRRDDDDDDSSGSAKSDNCDWF